MQMTKNAPARCVNLQIDVCLLFEMCRLTFPCLHLGGMRVDGILLLVQGDMF